jgi:hypothetical protein
VQQSLRAVGVHARFTSPYPDGRSRIEVRLPGRGFPQHTDDIDEAYIMGLRMSTADRARSSRVDGTLRLRYG